MSSLLLEEMTTTREQSVISRWVKRKIAHSQFSEENMDGRKSFVFSWNKKHRAIHEEALLHYFDPSKKGQKFEYQPSQGPSSQTPQSASSTILEKETVEEDPAQQLSSLVSRIEIHKGMNNTAGAIPKKFSTSSSSRGNKFAHICPQILFQVTFRSQFAKLVWYRLISLK